MIRRNCVFTAVLALCLLPLRSHGATGEPLDRLVAKDWAAQERRLDRSPTDVEAIRSVHSRAKALLNHLLNMPHPPDLAEERATLESLGQSVSQAEQLDAAGRLELYQQIRSLARGTAMKNPLLAGKRIAFMKRRRFVCQMLHEYLGYFYDYGDISGGGVYVLEKPGRSLDIRNVVEDSLPKGNFTTLALSYDAQTLYFGFAERAPAKPDYYSPERRCFHIWAVNVDGTNLRQLTTGCDDDFDPCPLPDGGIAFMSTRRGGFGRCHNPWEPLPAYTLHRMDADGGNVRTLSFHETNEWHPSVLNDGRILYSRWDYIDRSAANYHGLWVANPDGTNPAVIFGNYTQRINACYQGKAIPGSRRIAFIAGAHHAGVGGSLVLVDPDNCRLDPVTAEDRFESIEELTPEVCFPEGVGWPGSYFHSPWPLSEDCFLVAFSFKPLPGMGPNVKDDNYTGLYYFDRFGNLELLYADPDFSCMYPIPLEPRPMPPVVSSSLESGLADQGEFILTNVRESFFPLPESRPIRSLRIFQVLPKTSTHVANQPRIGHANAESARMLLGTVPIEKDGSAYFRAPARKPLYFQAVDANGRAVQTMRSVTYLQPGERRSCVGCHEPPGTASPARPDLLALRREPSPIEPGPQGTLPLSYPLLVQPVLDRHCVRCHDGSEGELKAPPVLSGEPAGTFNRSYQSLKPFVRWYEWGDKTIREIGTEPGRSGADESRLLKVIADKTHAEHVALSPEDDLRLTLWLDANVPFYGTYEKDAQVAQQAGQAVPPPAVQ
ncbi:MAG TPA: hypothetical protein VLI39_07385 [Sedimentisphaerales bacterium]|nr:hypothetical protein [Sedimentisphaerales bacterium]